MVLVDVLKRYQTLAGRKALMLTGTDEHGMKVCSLRTVELRSYIDTWRLD